MTENEALFFLAAKGCVWIPWGDFLVYSKRYSSLFFTLAIAHLKQLSQVPARATVSTFLYNNCMATVLYPKQLEYAWFWLHFRCCSDRCLDSHVLCMSNNF